MHLVDPETPIANKPFARGQAHRYLGRRFFVAADGARRAIDVWESACACGSTFRVCAYLESHNPDPAPRQCRSCRWKAKLAARREAKSVAKSIAEMLR
jgi:hypothetical protein